MENLESKANKKPMGMTLGDIGLATGTILGVGFSLLFDADTGNYITDVFKNFSEGGYLLATGFTSFGYAVGRFIDNFIK